MSVILQMGGQECPICGCVTLRPLETNLKLMHGLSDEECAVIVALSLEQSLATTCYLGWRRLPEGNATRERLADKVQQAIQRELIATRFL